MSKLETVEERVIFSDGSELSLRHGLEISYASWHAWNSSRSEVTARADVGCSFPGPCSVELRANCERLADGYEVVLAFVRFGIDLCDVEPANCAGCGRGINAESATSLHNHLTHQRDLVCVPCANEPGPSVYCDGVA